MFSYNSVLFIRANLKSSLFSGDGLHALAPRHDELVLERLAEEALVDDRGARPQAVRVVLARARARRPPVLQFHTSEMTI